MPRVCLVLVHLVVSGGLVLSQSLARGQAPAAPEPDAPADVSRGPGEQVAPPTSQAPAEDGSLEKLLALKITTGSKKEQKLIEVPATIYVVTAQQIRERGYEYLDDALRDVPGMQFQHINGTFPTLWGPRGLLGDENKRVLLLIDGIVDNSLLEGNVLGGAQYSLHNVKQIEIILGPASSLYGANAFNGIINIVTKSGEDINGVSVTGGYGTNHTHTEKILVGKREGNWDVSLSGHLYNTDGFTNHHLHPRYDDSYVRDAYSLVGRLRYKDVTIGVSHFDRPMGEGGFANVPAEYFGLPTYGYNNSEGARANGGLPGISLNGEHGSLWHSVTGTQFLSHRLSLAQGSFVLKSKAFSRQTGIAEDSYEYDFKDSPSAAWGRDPYTHHSYSFGGEVQSEYTPIKGHELIVGFLAERANVERGYRAVSTVVDSYRMSAGSSQRRAVIYDNVSGYGQYRFESELLSSSLVAGVRFDHNSVYGNTVNPRVGIVAHVTDWLTVKPLFGTAFRAPTNFELFTVTNVRIENPNLRPERERSFEVSFVANPSRYLLLENSYFYNEFSDIITSNVPVGVIEGRERFQNQNQGAASVKGMELSAGTFFLGLRAFANVTLQSGEVRQLGTRFDAPNIATVTANAGVNYALLNRLVVDVVGNYVGRRSVAPSNPRGSIPGYFLLHVAFSTRNLLDDRVVLSAVINNVLDRDWIDPGFRAADGKYYATQQFQGGISCLAKLTVSLF